MVVLTLFFLAACAEDLSDTGVPDPEVMCSHPASMFEAQVEVAYPDRANVESVEFILEQGGEFWTTYLRPPNDNSELWHTKMQIMEFDCHSEYFYDFVEEKEE